MAMAALLGSNITLSQRKIRKILEKKTNFPKEPRGFHRCGHVAVDICLRRRLFGMGIIEGFQVLS